MSIQTTKSAAGGSHRLDYTFNLPDECLYYIFQFLKPTSRRRCAFVCRQRLKLHALSDLIHVLPSFFIRFNSINSLSLCSANPPTRSIGDEALILISLNWKNLKSLRLRACREITADGIESFSKNCKSLKKLSCTLCSFGSRGINAVLDNCAGLEELCLNGLTGITDLISPGAAGSSLKLISLKNIKIGGLYFCQLITSLNSVRTLKLIECSGDWSTLMQSVAISANALRLHVEKVTLSRSAWLDILKCPKVKITIGSTVTLIL